MSSKASSKNSIWDTRRGVASAQVLARFGCEHGLPLDVVLAHTDIPPALLDDPKGQIDTAQEIQLIRNLVAALPHRPTLGLAAGTRYNLHSFGLWSYAVVSSPTWGSAIQVGSRMLSHNFLLTVHKVERVGHVALGSFDATHLPPDIRQFVLDRDRACAVHMQREMVGRLVPYREVRMTQPEPAPEVVQAYTQLYGIRPLFGQNQDSGCFDADILDQPLDAPSPPAIDACEQMCRQLVEARYTRSGVAANVRDRLLKTPGHIPDMEEVASAMNVTSRTLRRHLTAEGVTFRSLLEEVRSTLAEELMACANLTHGEIALRLGYADVTTFIEAFRRWNGMPPTEFRRNRGLPMNSRRHLRNNSNLS